MRKGPDKSIIQACMLMLKILHKNFVYIDLYILSIPFSHWAGQILSYITVILIFLDLYAKQFDL